MNRLGILLSGRGSNFLAIHAAIQEGPDGRLPNTEIAVVLSNKSDAPGLQAARNLGLEAHHIPIAGRTPEARDEEFIARLREAHVDLVCLAGYMRRLTPYFVAQWAGRMLNIHPSLLPAFPGLHTHRRALAAGVKLHGCTVHIVTDTIDEGPILAQAAVPVLPGDDEATLAARILIQEHALYPATLERVLRATSGRFDPGAALLNPLPITPAAP